MSDFAFVRDPPERVGEITAALGLTVTDVFGDGTSDPGFVVNDRFSATYAWDMHHEQPVRSAEDLQWRQLHDYCVFYAGGQAECEAALRAQHGAPQPVAERTATGRSSSAPATAGGSTLSGTRTSRIGRCRRPTRRSGSRWCGRSWPTVGSSRSGRRCRARAGPGARPAGHDRPQHGRAPEPLGARRTGRRELELLGRSVESTLDRRPSGPDVAGVSFPGGAVQHLGDDDIVRRLRIDQLSDCR
jgi:hypothetical protein